ncbi:MAG TPA: tetratricopeptide repeat protein [Rhodocyclaceae bacterium]|nr:tetratricopeptide repeat protein [Rhodocyclaceae bacterium]
MRTLLFLALLITLLGSGVIVHAQGVACRPSAGDIRNGQENCAVQAMKEAIAAAEKTYGPDHPALASRLDDLAALYVKQGQYARAVSLYHRSLAIYRKALGTDSPLLASTLDSLAPGENADSKTAARPSLLARNASGDSLRAEAAGLRR